MNTVTLLCPLLSRIALSSWCQILRLIQMILPLSSVLCIIMSFSGFRLSRLQALGGLPILYSPDIASVGVSVVI